MIRITKGPAPAVLGRLGPVWVAVHERAFDAHAADYLGGDRKMKIAEHVYGHTTVREALAAAQHSKCCYCEVEIEHPYMLRHVEHWRPKGAVRQAAGDTDLTPGYYWLAYDWSNLLLACGVCNSGNKGTSFPLDDDTLRARSHHDPLDREQPSILKPDAEDPEPHFKWIDDQPRGLSPEGWATIEVVGLIRQDDIKRSRAFANLQRDHRRLWACHDNESPTIRAIADECRESLERSVLPRSPFSAMAKAFLAKNALPPLAVA
ncbi:MAG: hypothetical protein JWR80_6006 [Bradyrhizobium sp.]|nr:hypothetical protein [Bradyrhizobium sp.]